MENRIEVFIKTSLKKILKLPLTDPDYENFGGSQNIFYNCIIRSKGKPDATIGDTCAEALRNVILHYVKKDKKQKLEIVNFLKTYLSDLEKNNNDIEFIVTKSISTFINPENKDFLRNINENKLIKNDSSKYSKDKITLLYEKINEYINKDNKLVLMVADELIEYICKSIFNREYLATSIIKRNTDNIDLLFYKRIIPKNVAIAMKNIKSQYESMIILKKIDSIESCITSIIIVIDWYLLEYLKCKDNINYNYYLKFESNYNYKEKYKIVDIYQLLSMGWTMRKFMEDTFDMWEDNLHIPEEHNGTVEQWTEIANFRPENRKILLEENDGKYEIVGYWSFMLLFNEYFNKIKTGNFYEKELSVKMIPPMVPGVYNIYFIGMCLNKKYRKSLAIQKLLFAVVDTLEELASIDIFIENICAWAYSDDGMALCKSIGLREIAEQIQHGKIYFGSINEILKKPFCKKSDLEKLYKNLHK